MKSFFSENIKALRKLRKLTLEELSDTLNISKSALSDYENDKFSPTILIARKIAEYFSVSVDQLEYSEILEKNESGGQAVKKLNSAAKEVSQYKNFIEELEVEKNQIEMDLKLQKQKIEGLQVQFKLQEQLREGKEMEIMLLKTQIGLLEDNIKLRQTS
ncbi:MAG: helix-turn-helix domain-containing protein [Leadbetterella sp.]